MLLYVYVVLCVCFVLKVFLTEYAGPLVIYLLFYARPAMIYGAEASVSQHTWASQSVTCRLSFCPNLSHNWTKMHIYAHFLCWTSLESVAYLCAFLLNWSELIAYLCVLSLLGLNDELLQLDIQVSVCLLQSGMCLLDVALCQAAVGDGLHSPVFSQHDANTQHLQGDSC